MTVIIGGLSFCESRHVRIWDEVGGETANVREADKPQIDDPRVTVT